MIIKAVIFDLDGVLVSTDHFHYLAWKYMADKEGIPFNQAINNRLRGVSRMESLNIILEMATRPYTEEEKIKLAEIKNTYYVSSLKTLTPNNILSDVLHVIEQLKKKNIRLAIGSSSKNAQFILNQIELAGQFDAIADGHDIIFSKPAPDIFLVAAKKLNLAPIECLVVEDAEAGIVAAKMAGMMAFAVGDAQKSKLADYRSGHLIDLLDMF